MCIYSMIKHMLLTIAEKCKTIDIELKLALELFKLSCNPNVFCRIVNERKIRWKMLKCDGKLMILQLARDQHLCYYFYNRAKRNCDSCKLKCSNCFSAEWNTFSPLQFVFLLLFCFSCFTLIISLFSG